MGSLLEYGGLKPILPFFEGRSDAACRVVIWPSRLPPMGAYGLYHAALVREGTREWAGNSRDTRPSNRDAARHVATNAPLRLPHRRRGPE